jgi:hypothetical protein
MNSLKSTINPLISCLQCFPPSKVWGIRGFGAGEIQTEFHPHWQASKPLFFTLHLHTTLPLSYGAEAAAPEAGHYPAARQGLLKMPAETVAAVSGAI